MASEFLEDSGPTRRQFLRMAAGGALGLAALPTLLRARPAEPEGMSLGFGLYGMKGTPPATGDFHDRPDRLRLRPVVPDPRVGL